MTSPLRTMAKLRVCSGLAARKAGAAAAGSNLVNGRISFAAYMGNALRYDVDLGQGVTFKVDIRDPWHHEQQAMGRSVSVGFPVTSTVAIPAE